MAKTFSSDFLFGAATSSHQVEGGNIHNDWWAWERSPQRTAALKRLGLNPLAFTSGKACDHYTLFREDFNHAQALGHNAHRFSIEWSRIEPEEGVWDTSAIAHYREVLEALRERHITPVVTLHHFTNPLWFARRGGWAQKQAPEIFARYTATIAKEFATLAPWWITINEPSAYAAQGYLSAQWPPAETNPLKALRVMHNMTRAHRLAYSILKEAGAEHVGIAYSCRAWYPATNRPWDRFAAAIAKKTTWGWFLNTIARELDYIGINYYFANRIGLRLGNPVQRGCGAKQKSDMGWDLCPDGLRLLIEEIWSAFRKPILITENGLADADDSRRERFIIEHLTAIQRALDAGAHVRGYLHWSLLDNFEWAEGFAPRFGLIAIDYTTLKRTPRPSANRYAGICRTHMLPET